MARSQELNNDFDPRHRVVGAVILVTIAVIVLPLILDEHPTLESAGAKQGEVAAAGGEPASRVVVKTIVNGQALNQSTIDTKKPEPALPKTETATPVTVSQTAVAGKTVATGKQPLADVDNKKEPAKSAPVATVKKTETKESKGPHWAVQVGTFSNEGNVRRLSKQLKEHGYSVIQKNVPLKQGSGVRVRVGPYSSRAKAEQAQVAINKQIGVKGVVVTGP